VRLASLLTAFDRLCNRFEGIDGRTRRVGVSNRTPLALCLSNDRQLLDRDRRRGEMALEAIGKALAIGGRGSVEDDRCDRRLEVECDLTRPKCIDHRRFGRRGDEHRDVCAVECSADVASQPCGTVDDDVSTLAFDPVDGSGKRRQLGRA